MKYYKDRLLGLLILNMENNESYGIYLVEHRA
jgi:hypothetical protein